MVYQNMEQRSQKWYDWRRRGITATEAVAICGHSKFATPWRVWAEKTGRVQPVDLSKNPYVRYGIQHEQDALDLFMEKHGEIVLPACGEMASNRVFRASFDGLTSLGEPVEVKCPSEGNAEEVLLLGEESAPYQMYRWQVQWQMMVSGAQRGYLVFFMDGHLVEFVIARDETMIAEMQGKCSAFWQENILRDQPPEKMPERDDFVPNEEESLLWEAAAEKFRSLKAEIDRLQKELEVPKQQLIELMGEFTHADCCGVSISRYTQRGSVDYKSALKSLGVKLSDQELEAFRRKDSQITKVTLSSKS